MNLKNLVVVTDGGEGLIDHHHSVYSMLKTCFKREESNILFAVITKPLMI